MYIRLIRNQPKGIAIAGRLVIDGRWFCDTLERVGYQILPLCYHVAVTQSPKFKRLLPLVTGVPRSIVQNGVEVVQNGVELSPAEKTTLNHSTQPLNQSTPSALRTGIRFHRGTKPEHSTGCILVVADNPLPLEGVDSSGMLSKLSSNKKNIGSRSAADVETQLTQLLLQTQESHEEIILEVTDFRPGTEYGYNTPCPSELQKR